MLTSFFTTLLWNMLVKMALPVLMTVGAAVFLFIRIKAKVFGQAFWVGVVVLLISGYMAYSSFGDAYQQTRVEEAERKLKDMTDRAESAEGQLRFNEGKAVGDAEVRQVYQEALDQAAQRAADRAVVAKQVETRIIERAAQSGDPQVDADLDAYLDDIGGQ